MNDRKGSLGKFLNESPKRRVKNSRESRRVSTRFRASPRHSSRLLLRHGNHGFIHAGSTWWRIWRASARVHACTRASAACVRLARRTRVVDIYLLGCRTQSICIVGRLHVRGHACTYARTRVRKSHGDSVPSGIHGIAVPRGAGERRIRASVSISRAHAHTDTPSYNGCLADTAPRRGTCCERFSSARRLLDAQATSEMIPLILSFHPTKSTEFSIPKIYNTRRKQ